MHIKLCVSACVCVHACVGHSGILLQSALQEEEGGGDTEDSEKPQPFPQPELRLSQALTDLKSQVWFGEAHYTYFI